MYIYDRVAGASPTCTARKWCWGDFRVDKSAKSDQIRFITLAAAAPGPRRHRHKTTACLCHQKPVSVFLSAGH